MDQFDEYTVHVAGIAGTGYLNDMTYNDYQWAVDEAERLRSQYQMLGLPSVAETVTVRARTVELHRSAWRSVTAAPYIASREVCPAAPSSGMEP